MKRCLLGGAVVAAVVLFPADVSGQAAPPDPAKYGWHTSLEKARALARQTGQPLFVVFRCEP